ncbi:MAG TPA: efflux RND transporter periplasmic adaptor subunit [Anaerohalosphaeraceae bacterium]|jgi:HlyD family secretion protein|nr:efflux RND transporter periplasmic adaptor subunit [Anaerohalosphaeraceae bacterium]
MTQRNSRILKIGVVLAIVVVVVAGTAFKLTATEETEFANASTFIVQQGPLTISISESGTIKALDQEVIKSEVEGSTTILWVIPEGTRVKAGDVLVELDASELTDRRIDQQTVVQNAETAWIAAREALAVGRNQAQADVELAQLTLDFAKLDLEKYTGEKGEYESLRTEAEADIKLAQEELLRAEEKLKWSKKLAAENYISSTELQTDELTYNKAVLNLELARNKLDLLEDFTYKRQLAQLNSDVSQAEMALERTKRSSAATVIQLEAELRAAEAKLEREKTKLAKIEDQIAKATIKAPADGIVVYATSAKGSWRGNQEPLEEGQTVHERAELIYLPTSDAVKAEIKIHESSLEKVRLDLPVIVTVDALQGQTFTGKVAKIALLPDAASMWMNPDLKVYATEIHISGDSTGLRTGMSCRAEIIVERYENVVYIPVQAVVRIDRQPTVYVQEGGKFVKRQVDIGMDNNRMIHIKSGLQPGEVVLLTPPLAPAEARKPEKIDELEIPHMPPDLEGAGSERPGRNQGDGQAPPAQRPAPGGDERGASNAADTGARDGLQPPAGRSSAESDGSN